MTILSPQHMTMPTNTVFHCQLSYGFLLALHEHQICRSFSVFELYSTHCSHHGSLCSSYNSNLTFSQASCFTSIQYYRPYIALLDSPFQLWRKSPAIQKLTALPKLSLPTSCSGSYCSLTSSTSTHPVTKICEFPYSFHFIT